jgi:NADH:ubiquinone oxidoreductase subunit C
MYNHLILSYNYNIILNVQQQNQNGYPNQIQTLQKSWPAAQWKASNGKESSKIWR